MTIKTTLPTDSATRKRYPMLRGALRYAPAAWAGMARISINGNDKHNPGEELHHARGKSTDHGDCILRHLTDAEDIQAALERGNQARLLSDDEKDQLREEVDQLMWRTALYVQQIHEKYLGAPLAPGAKLPKVPEPKPGTVTTVCGFVHRDSHGLHNICQLPVGHGGNHREGSLSWTQRIGYALPGHPVTSFPHSLNLTTGRCSCRFKL